ncbi:MAG TPA: lipase maturation factor family protein [Rhodoglobus sp.]|nr:lipase maturation factor family protein [Rhodoglobus sp.]
MDWFGAGDYEVARQVLQRGTAAVFLVAFWSTLNQFPALLGERGLLPTPQFIAMGGVRGQPTLFRWGYTDRLLRGVCAAGILIAALLVIGVPQLAGPWAPMVAFLLLWALYLSIVTVGQTFYGFGWETLLLEAGFLVAFLGSNDQAPPLLTIILIRWLVFRLEFGAGMIKMRGGREWRDLTALDYHHETQPMPNPLSRFAHLMPRWFHRGEVLGNHVAQLVVPWLLFAPQPVASIAALIVVATQGWLVLTGNFAWLNILTMILAFSAVSDDVLRVVIPVLPAGADADPPLWWAVVVIGMTVLVLVLSWRPLRNLFSRRQLMNASFNRFRLINAYGAFGSVTKQRDEIIIEGTRDDDPLTARWEPYEFKGKPGDPTRVPRQFAPYHLRLDWLMWFLALGAHERWFGALLQKLLQADPAILKLLRVDPFDGQRPTYVRATVWSYRFATHEERRRTGMWWMREPVGDLVRPARLRP